MFTRFFFLVHACGVPVVMLVLASPVLALRLGLSDAGNDPASSTTRKAYDLLARLTQTLQSENGVAAVVPFPSKPGAKVADVQVIPTTAPQDARTSELITHLRSTVIPAAEKGSSLHILVGGSTAIFDDFAAIITSKLPLFIGVIVGLGFLLLLIAFRSLLIPATAAVMNLLAAAPDSASSSPSSSGAGARTFSGWAGLVRWRPSCP